LFIEHLGDDDCPSKTEAAKRAGFEYPNRAVGEILSKPHVRDAAFRVLHNRCKEKVRWRDLIDEAMQVLSSAMRHGDAELALKAASKGLDVAIRLGEETLAARAVKEDIATDSREALAAAYLGALASAAENALITPDEPPQHEQPPVLLMLNPSRESEH
jgi:hypothetical protein